MAIKVSGTEVISNARELSNIASVDATTVTSLNDAGVGGGFKPVSVSGATQALNLGSYNFFNANDLTVNTTLSFTSVPTDALWTYTTTALYTEAYTFSGGTYSGLSKNVSAQEADPWGVEFSADGTKMYMVGGTNNTVFQYTLSTPWDVSTATYASLSKSVSAQTGSAYSVRFKPDGLKMYISGGADGSARSKFIYQYTLSTAWAVNTATYASLSKDVSAQTAEAQGLFFKPDGLKMYVLGQSNDTVYQYTLSTAWDVSTATYASLSKNVSAQQSVPYGVAFSSDGLKMFITGFYGEMYQYTLSTAWNVSTATYASISLNPGPQGSNARNLTFSADGTKCYSISSTYDVVSQLVTSIIPTITVPAAVQNPPTTAFNTYDQVSYTFVTNDGGTTVKLINEAVV